MTVEDENTGYSHTASYSQSGMYPDGTAEWILERSEQGSGAGAEFPELAQAPVTFTGAEASSPTNSLTGVGNLSHYYDVMENCTSAPDVQLAAPGAVSSNGDNFTNNWEHFGAATLVKNCTGIW